MGVLPDVRGLNGTDLFENTKILIELEKRASQFNGPGGDLFPRHHIKWPRASFAPDWVAGITGIRKAELIKRGVDPFLAHTTAWSGKGPWAISHTPGVRIALDDRFFDQMGLIRLYTPHRM